MYLKTLLYIKTVKKVQKNQLQTNRQTDRPTDRLTNIVTYSTQQSVTQGQYVFSGALALPFFFFRCIHASLSSCQKSAGP